MRVLWLAPPGRSSPEAGCQAAGARGRDDDRDGRVSDHASDHVGDHVDDCGSHLRAYARGHVEPVWVVD